MRDIETKVRDLTLRGYSLVVDGVIICLIFLMLLVLLFSFADVVVSTYRMIPELRAANFEAEDFRGLVENVLDVFIIIELFSTFAEYVRSRRVRISGLLDVTVVFALREILVKLYSQSFATTGLIGLCLVALILVIARTITGRFPPQQTNGRPAQGDTPM